MFYTNKMFFYVLCAFSVTAFQFGAAEKLALPPIITCKQNSANFHDCLKDAIQEAWPLFVKGLPEFDVLPIDPIFFEQAKVTFDKSAIRGKLILSNLTAYGVANTRFISVRSFTNFHKDVFRLEIDVRIPRIFGEGDCVAEGTIGPFKMGGKGHFNMTIEDLSGPWIITGPVVNDTWTVEHVHVAPIVKKMKIYLNNLFHGNKEINDFAMAFVNEYWPSLYRVMLPIAAETWDPWLTDICNHFFSKVSFSELFL